MKPSSLARALGTAVASGALLALLTAPAHAGPDAPAISSGSFLLAQATPPSAGSPATASQKTRNPDQKFVEEAAHGGMAEVEAGKLAQKQASQASVKAFAEHMVTDHTRANDQLKQIAMTKGMTLPTELDRSHKRNVEKLGKLQGADFDRDYMKMMVADHKKTVSLFEKEAKSGKDPELKQFAATLLPDLQKHLQMAESTEKEIKKSSTAQDQANRSATMK